MLFTLTLETGLVRQQSESLRVPTQHVSSSWPSPAPADTRGTEYETVQASSPEYDRAVSSQNLLAQESTDE